MRVVNRVCHLFYERDGECRREALLHVDYLFTSLNNEEDVKRRTGERKRQTGQKEQRWRCVCVCVCECVCVCVSHGIGFRESCKKSPHMSCTQKLKQLISPHEVVATKDGVITGHNMSPSSPQLSFIFCVFPPHLRCTSFFSLN